jgi:hypothetical protein
VANQSLVEINSGATNLGTLLRDVRTEDYRDAKILSVHLDFCGYHSGPFRGKFFLAEQVQGGTYADTQGLDNQEIAILDTAFGGKEFEHLPITPYRKGRCVGSNVWTIAGNVNITKPVQRWLKNRSQDREGDTEFMLLYLAEQNAAAQSEIIVWVDVTWVDSLSGERLSLIP